jgi:hypothetical protein
MTRECQAYPTRTFRFLCHLLQILGQPISHRVSRRELQSSSVDVPAADALEQQADISTDATGCLKEYQQAEQLLINQGAFLAFEQPFFS